MKIRPVSTVLQCNGTRLERKLITRVCHVCGEFFRGRADAKACGHECTAKLRSLSARNRTYHP